VANLNEAWIYRFKIDAIAKAQAIQNRLDYRAEVGVSPGTTDDAFTQLMATWRSAVLPVLPAEYKVARYTLEVLSGKQNILNADGSPSSRLTLQKEELREANGNTLVDLGGKAGAVTSTFNAVGFRKRTTRPGKSYRGSMRLGPVLVVDMDEQEVLAASQGAYQVAANNLVEIDFGEGLSSLRLIVFGETAFLRGGDAAIGLFTADVVDFALKTFITSQVSRKEKKTFGG